MSVLKDKLTPHIEFINAKRCAVVRDQAISPLVVLKEFYAEAPIGERILLRRFHLACKAGFLSEFFDGYRPDLPATQVLQPSFCLEGTDSVWMHVYFAPEHSILSSCWRIDSTNSHRLCAKLYKLYVLGNSSKDPVDLFLEYFEQAFINLSDLIQRVGMQFIAERAELQFDIVRCIFDSEDWDNLEIAPGYIRIYNVDNILHIEYDVDPMQAAASEDAGEQVIQVAQFSQHKPTELPENEDVQLLSSDIVRLDDADSLISHSEEMAMLRDIHEYSNASGGRVSDRMMSDISLILGSQEQTGSSDKTVRIRPIDKDCPAIRAIHRSIAYHEPVTYELALKAVEETERYLDKSLIPCMLFLLHQWYPSLDEEFKLTILMMASSDDYEPLTFSILKDIYQNQHNETMLLALIERQSGASQYNNRHRYIQLELEYIHILSEQLNMFNLALRRLNQLRPVIMQSRYKEEHIQFALSYHDAESTVIAIQYLKQWMQNAETPELVAAYGIELANLMIEHNEPMQSIIVVCQQILEADPDAMQAMELMAQCFEASNQLDDASNVWQGCFEKVMRLWEKAGFVAEVTPSAENRSRLEYYRDNALRIAAFLENVLTQLDSPHILCLVYQQHLRLEPDSLHTFSELLKVQESLKMYEAMVMTCQNFLQANQGTLLPKDEVPIRLTLHNIYDRELGQPEDALEQLDLAEKLSAMDARVIMTKLERCCRRGQKEEQIDLRLALIEVLPPDEAADQTIELVRLYESLGASNSIIMDALRKACNRAPNHPQILIELRNYLRKTGQNFELAATLEKLAKLTLDLQVRKNILMEASEVHEKLGNIKISQALYHEAQLCSPINPDSKAPFILNPSPYEESPEKTDSKLSPLPSIYLTSRSLSVVEDYDHLTSEAEAEEEVDENAQTQFNPKRSADNSSPSIKTQIVEARLHGNPNDLLDRLLQSICDIPEDRQPPRVLQEIGCIYLYDCKDFEKARQYLEHASALDEEIAYGEQTLNALETIYQALKLYRELSEIYIKKCKILTISNERRKYEIRLAQLRYEHLNETDEAVETLKQLLKRDPNNENALQLLAQIYIDKQYFDEANDVLKTLNGLLKPGTKASAQMTLRLIALNLENNHLDSAKKYMLELLYSNGHVDKLAIIELYKRTCRKNDEWEELLLVLNREMAFYMNIPFETFDIQDYLKNPFANQARNISHSLREYADVLYKKMNDTDLSVRIYHLLAFQNPDDDYSRNVLFEIAETDPNDKIISFIFDAYSSQGMSIPSFLEFKQAVENHAPEEEITEMLAAFTSQLDSRKLNYFQPLLSFVESHFTGGSLNHEQVEPES